MAIVGYAFVEDECCQDAVNELGGQVVVPEAVEEHHVAFGGVGLHLFSCELRFSMIDLIQFNSQGDN